MLRKSALSPRNVFMNFIYVSQQTIIISRLVFVLETQNFASISKLLEQYIPEFDVFLTFLNYQLNAQFLYSSTICMLHIVEE